MDFTPKHPQPLITSDEVRFFHPYFEDSLDKALKNSGLNEKYHIKHHVHTSSGIVDFAVVNTKSSKILLPFEIKRTTMSVRSLGRRQARDYYYNLGSKMCSRYYCSTNLELIELFKDSDSRKETHSQLVKLKGEVVGQFGDDSNDVFFKSLTSSLEEVLNIVDNDSGEYSDKLTKARSELHSRINNVDSWHEFFLPFSFEYIIGASEKSKELKKRITDIGWPKTAELYKKNPERIIDIGSKLDFSGIFSLPAPKPNDQLCFDTVILDEAYNSGLSRSLGEDISELVNAILKPEGKGIVETDVELARLLSVIANDSLDESLNSNDVIFDPCAGSGRLLTTLDPVFCVNPGQVWANEIKRRFKEPLTLRLGMYFINSLSQANKPKVTIKNISEISSDECVNVKVVLLNPPYLSGIDSIKEKNEIESSIVKITGKKSKLNNGQISLEAVFLELIYNLVPNGCVISCILPIQHLTRKSKEVERLRDFLINEFGLTHIVKYPMDGLFSDVIKETVILSGRKGNCSESVKLISINRSVSNLDINGLIKFISGSDINNFRGVDLDIIKRSDLKNSLGKGWKGLIGFGVDAILFIKNNLSGCLKLNSLGNGKIISRGTLGNSGSARLAAISRSDSVLSSLLEVIPSDWVRNGINNSKDIPSIIDDESKIDISIYPPNDAFDFGTENNSLLKKIVDLYLALLKSENKKSGKQLKHDKSADKIIEGLKRDQRVTDCEVVLIPRATRNFGRVSVLNSNNTIVSTNFIKVKVDKFNERIMLASWISSVFGQIQMELIATPQEGMRKIEVGSVNDFLVPDFSIIHDIKIQRIIDSYSYDAPLDFKNLQRRDTDEIWSDILFDEFKDKFLDDAFCLMERLVYDRNP